MSRPSGRRFTRRYVPLLGALAYFPLAMSLPSALTLPKSGPPTLAEFAPVPGHSNDAASPVAELAQTSSAGVGAGGTAQGAGVDTTTSVLQAASGVPGGKARAGTKRCVGQPPRQTEDPLSPTCIAFFEGDNGGSTAKGVTANEVRVVVASNSCNSASRGTPVLVDYDEHPNGNELAPAYPAALARHFADRFQTYERRIHLFWFQPACVSGSDGSSQRRASIQYMNERVQPFAAVPLGADDDLADEAARLGIVTLLEGGARATLDQRAPYMMSLRPDLEETASHVAGFLCQVLAGRPATYSGDLAAKQQTRRFAMMYSINADRANRGEQLIRQDVREQCGDAAGEISDWTRDPALDVARWHNSERITTIIWIGGDVRYISAAEAQGWHPEWYAVYRWDPNKSGWLSPPTQWRNAFGLLLSRRLAERASEQDAYRAFHAGCPDCPWDPEATFLYDSMLMFFTGLQSAGPRLSAAPKDRGLRALPIRRAPNPWTPSSYFAPGQHFFQRDAAVIRWDPTGTIEGSPQPGCYGLVESGRRYRVDDWPTHPGDAVFDGEKWPCMGESPAR